MRVGPLIFTKLWTNAKDFPRYEGSETQVRADMQYLFNEIRDFINDKVLGAVNTITAGDITVQDEQGAESLSERLSEIATDIDGLEEEIRDVSVGTMPDESITTAKIHDEAVTTDKLAISAVTTTKIAANAVTTDKLAFDSVTTSRIVDAAVETAKIADGAVTGNKMSDTSWNAVTEFGVNIEQYADEQPVVYRKIGNVVYLRGACKATAELQTLNGDTFSEVPVEHLLFELPAGFRPSRSLFMVCHGSNACVWMLRIYGTDTAGSEGRVTLSRYSEPHRGYTNVEAGAWLPFCISFPVG